MKLRTRDKKKDRLILTTTIVGMIVVVAVWAFQLRVLFTDTMAQEGKEISGEYAQTIEELEDFQQQVENEFPNIAQNFEEIIQMIDEQNAAELEARRQQEEEAIGTAASQAADILQQQYEAQQAAEQEALEGEEESTTTEE